MTGQEINTEIDKRIKNQTEILRDVKEITI